MGTRAPASEGIVSIADVLYAAAVLFSACTGWCLGLAQDREGPFIAIGHWLNARAARKTLRLLHAVAYWAAERELTE
jgi:hypothetical protein